MDNPQGSSFIPKSPVSGSPRPHKVRRVYLFTYITLIIFIGSLLAAGGAYGWSVLANRKLQTEQAALAKEKNRFNQSDIDMVRWRSAQLAAVAGLLDHHPFVYSIFKALDASTVRNVTLSNFTLDTEKNNPNSLTFKVTVSALNTNDLLFQRQAFEKNQLFSDATFTAMTVGESSSATSTVPGTKVKQVSFVMGKVFKPGDLPVDSSLFGNTSVNGLMLPVPVSTTTPTTTVAGSIMPTPVAATSTQ